MTTLDGVHPSAFGGHTPREVLAAIDPVHTWHTAVAVDGATVTCSCEAKLVVTEDVAVKLGLEHREVVGLLVARLPGRLKA